jgi:hypothetical protein
MWMAPKHVYRMGDTQSNLRSDQAREAYIAAVQRRDSQPPIDRWFQDTTREPIRDETLKDSLVLMGAVITRAGIPTTSSKGRYALQSAFASLFDPALADEPLATAIAAWQEQHLSAGALARVRLQQRSALAAQSRVLITLPNGETRQMEPGPSSVITKAVVEVFAPRFMKNPAVLWISESGNKIIQRDEQLAQAVGLQIEADKLLPDMILVDLAPAEPLVVFVEAVASAGEMTEARRAAFLELIWPRRPPRSCRAAGSPAAGARIAHRRNGPTDGSCFPSSPPLPAAARRRGRGSPATSRRAGAGSRPRRARGRYCR